MKTVLFLMGMQSPSWLRGCGNLQSVDRSCPRDWDEDADEQIKIKRTKQMKQPHLEEVNNIGLLYFLSCGGRVNIDPEDIVKSELNQTI